MLINNDNKPGNVNYDRFVKKENLDLNFFLKMIANTGQMIVVMMMITAVMIALARTAQMIVVMMMITAVMIALAKTAI